MAKKAFDVYLFIMYNSGSPAKQPLKQQVLGPYNAMNGFVWCVADSAHWVCLGSLFRLALKAFGLAPDVHCSLQDIKPLAHECHQYQACKSKTHVVDGIGISRCKHILVQPQMSTFVSGFS